MSSGQSLGAIADHDSPPHPKSTKAYRFRISGAFSVPRVETKNRVNIAALQPYINRQIDTHWDHQRHIDLLLIGFPTVAPKFLLFNRLMILDRVRPGKPVPDDADVIIESPTHGEPVKYEVDKDTGAMFVDRFLSTAMRYPCNYGYIPETLSADGDPVDALVLTPRPLISDSVIRCRPVGVLEMEDEAGDDAKLIAVPIDNFTSQYRHIASFRDINRVTLDQISHFFEHYKGLEPAKWVKLKGWADTDNAKSEILESVKRYDQ